MNTHNKKLYYLFVYNHDKKLYKKIFEFHDLTQARRVFLTLNGYFKEERDYVYPFRTEKVLFYGEDYDQNKIFGHFKGRDEFYYSIMQMNKLNARPFYYDKEFCFKDDEDHPLTQFMREFINSEEINLDLLDLIKPSKRFYKLDGVIMGL